MVLSTIGRSCKIPRGVTRGIFLDGHEHVPGPPYHESSIELLATFGTYGAHEFLPYYSPVADRVLYDAKTCLDTSDNKYLTFGAPR